MSSHSPQRRFFHRHIEIRKSLIGETDFNYNFIKIKLSIHITHDVPMIFVYPFLEVTGVNKHLSIKLRKTGTVFQLLLSIFKSKLKTFLKDFD